MDDELNRRIAELDARLDRIEKALGLTHRAAPSRPPADTPPESVPTALPIHTPVASEPPPPAPQPIAPSATGRLDAVEPPPAAPPSPPHPRPAQRAPLPPWLGAANTQRPVEAPPASRRSVEELIGQRWMAWVGAVVVVVAVGFFVKLAYDLGWWGRIPPLGKCLAAAAFGSALLGAGELAFRRAGRAAAVGLYGAGLGTLYMTAFATFRYYELVSATGAFWLMLLVAALGIAVTVRGRLLPIGVLALVGGYLSPVLLAGQITFAAALPLYSTALLAVALGLSAALPADFRLLRYVGLGLHVVIASWWMHEEAAAHWLLAMIFLTLWWVLVNAEALLAAFRGQSAQGNALATFFFTFWYVSVGCAVLASAEPGQRNWLGVFAGAVAAVSAWIALPFGPGLGVLRQRPRRAMERLVVAYWGQVGILVAAAFALQFRDSENSFGQTIGWLAMALACIELGRRLPSIGVSVFGLLVGLLGVVRAWSVDWQLTALQPVCWSYGDVSVSYWCLLALGAVGATHVAARRLRFRHGGPQHAAAVLTVLGTLQWLVLCILACQHLALTAGWLLMAVALLALAPFGQSPGYRVAAVGVLLLAAGKWLVFDALWMRVVATTVFAAARPVVNWETALALALFACAGWVFHTRYGRTPTTPDEEREGVGFAWAARTAAEFLLAAFVVFLLIALSFEVERALLRWEQSLYPEESRLWAPAQLRVLWLSMLWTTAGVATIAFAVPRRGRCLFECGWGLIGIGALAGVFVGMLIFRVDRGVVPAACVLNVQFAAGVVATLALWAAAAVAQRAQQPAESGSPPSAVQQAMLAGALTLLVTLTFELDRLLALLGVDRLSETRTAWPPMQARLLWWTLLWAAGGAGLWLWGRLRRAGLLHTAGLLILMAAAAAWLVADTLSWRMSHGPALCRVVLNAQFAVGLVVALLACWVASALPGHDETGKTAAWGTMGTRSILLGAVVAIGLWLGSLELDRFFAPEAARVSNPAMARQTALSIFWGLYGIVLVALGFWRRWPVLRYAGLGLLAVTLGKVVLIDLAHVQYVYRVLSLLAVGLLFLATSVAYAKLASRLGGRPPTTS